MKNIQRSSIILHLAHSKHFTHSAYATGITVSCMLANYLSGLFRTMTKSDKILTESQCKSNQRLGIVIISYPVTPGESHP